MTTRPASISAKLTWMNLTVTGTVLVLAILAFFLYDIVSFRRNLIRSLEASAQIVGTNSVAAIIFNDPVSAATTLDALRSSPDVRQAALFTPAGVRFAEYRQPGSPDLLAHLPQPSGNSDRYWLEGTHVILAHPILFEGKLSGTVCIAAELRETSRRARQYLLMAALVLFVCMLAALLISATARRMVAQPLIALSETARRVSRERDYSVRAPPPIENDEIAALVRSFNEMLGQIQERDTALNRARDTLEKRVEERTAALRAANRELETFSYTVAHDLRGPLDSIQGLVYLLQTMPPDAGSTERAELLAQLREATRSMAALIDDLLHLSQASTAPLECKAVDLSALARPIAQELLLAHPERNVEFIIAETAPADADEGLMRVVLDNLLRNSWKYTSHHDRARIEFGMRRVNGYTVYFVRDDGAGFDPAQAGQLFQPFHRLHTRGEFPGTGIGLATVQRILARHGGRIWAEAQPEKGATFSFTLTGGESTRA